jgi:hypothetical protein
MCRTGRFECDGLKVRKLAPASSASAAAPGAARTARPARATAAEIHSRTALRARLARQTQSLVQCQMIE